jgi:hypothetical protein
MSRHATISLIAAAFGAGLLGMSPASAVPANGVVIGATAGAVTQSVAWRTSTWRWRPGWRGYENFRYADDNSFCWQPGPLPAWYGWCNYGHSRLYGWRPGQ